MDLIIVFFFSSFIHIQEDFDEFSDVEDLYSTLPMEKVEALEDMVSLAPSSLVKVKLQMLFAVTVILMNYDLVDINNWQI